MFSKYLRKYEVNKKMFYIKDLWYFILFTMAYLHFLNVKFFNLPPIIFAKFKNFVRIKIKEYPMLKSSMYPCIILCFHD